MVGARRCELWLFAASLLLSWKSAIAAPSPIHIDAVTDCPSALDVRFALLNLVPDLPILDKAVKGARTATILDSGSRYSVVVGRTGRETREFMDTGRNCAERAQNIATFISEVLEPPQIGSDTEPARSAARPATPPAVIARRLKIGGAIAIVVGVAGAAGGAALVALGAERLDAGQDGGGMIDAGSIGIFVGLSGVCAGVTMIVNAIRSVGKRPR